MEDGTGRETTHVRVEVTAGHFARARELAAAGASRATYCPVALACRDAGFPFALVGRDDLYLVEWDEHRPLPPAALAVVRAFDRGYEPDVTLPVSFWVEVGRPRP